MRAPRFSPEQHRAVILLEVLKGPSSSLDIWLSTQISSRTIQKILKDLLDEGKIQVWSEVGGYRIYCSLEETPVLTRTKDGVTA